MSRVSEGFKLSPSRISLFTECPRCFWLEHIAGVTRPDFPFPSLPSGMDRIIKEHFDTYRLGEDDPPELDGIDDTLFPDPVKLDEWRRSRSYGLSWEDDEGNVLGGGIDDLLISPDDRLVVLDYKTKGREPTDGSHEYYRDQLAFYTLIFEKLGYDVEDYAYLLYYHPDRVDGDGSFLFHNHLEKMEIDTDRAESLFRRALEVLESEEPDSAEDCEFCRWAGEA